MWSKAQAGADTHSSQTTHSMVWRRAKQGGKRMQADWLRWKGIEVNKPPTSLYYWALHPCNILRCDERRLPSMYQFWYTVAMKPILNASFYSSDPGNEPVRAWLKSLPASDRKVLGEDIKTVQFGWPLGMPLVRHLEGGIWEIRVKLENRIARVLFCLEGSTLVLLHGFIKKQQSTPKQDLDLAKERLKILKRK